MSKCQFFETSPRILNPLDETKAKAEYAELSEKLSRSGNNKLPKKLNNAPGMPAFLGAVFNLSPFLRDCASIDPDMFADIASRSFEETKQTIQEECVSLGLRLEDVAELMSRLRKLKRKTALLCALADLGGWWSGKTVTAALSDFADAALSACLDFILLTQEKGGKLALVDSTAPQYQSGLIVLGMGKHGARELNYSSDIDLILLFDERAPITLHTDDPVTLLGRMAKQLVKMMQERTGDGYVFRMDLRLRPDPSSTPPVMPLGAALNYYEGQGQNWERAALIKARPVAGDLEAGAGCLKELSPFVWRKYLDFAAIQDVHSIKRQIHAHKGHGEIAVKGHNVKLGRGGIREIEFFAQTQQLIAGGRNEKLRERRTIEALKRLSEQDWISPKVVDELSDAYWYLRNLEHRLQMVSDEQTHTLPDNDKDLKRIAFLMGDTSVASFSKQLTKVLKQVEGRYAELFEAAPELSTIKGNLVFTGDDEDPGTVETLSALGYQRASEIIKIVKGWHYGRVPALQSAQARELLTELAPHLLKEFAKSGNPDEAMFAFSQFVSGLPAGIQLFAILSSNKALTSLLARILGAAPRLADAIARKPHIFDGLLDPQFMNTLATKEILGPLLDADLERAVGYESALDQARRFFSEHKFLIGIRYFGGTLTTHQTGEAFSELAEVMISSLLPLVQSEFESRHGKIPGGRICILAMGRLGSRELTATSDLDLIFLYDHDADAEYSDGEKPLATSQYFIRLTQRLITAMSAPTAEGLIYELDFRLRPSGKAGPLATHVDGFIKYQGEEAWVWESQALTRARPVAGDAVFCSEIGAKISELLSHASENPNLGKEIRDMRLRIEKEKAGSGPWDVKNTKGGLIDIEFIAQWLTLKNGPADNDATSIRNAISSSSAEDIEIVAREKILSAFDLYCGVLQIQRICLGPDGDIDVAPSGFVKTLRESMDLPDLKSCAAHLMRTQEEIRGLFNKILPPVQAEGNLGKKATMTATTAKGKNNET